MTGGREKDKRAAIDDKTVKLVANIWCMPKHKLHYRIQDHRGGIVEVLIVLAKQAAIGFSIGIASGLLILLINMS